MYFRQDKCIAAAILILLDQNDRLNKAQFKMFNAYMPNYNYDITFPPKVMVVGDGSQEPVTIAGDKLRDQDQLAKIGAELVMPKTVKESRKALGDKVFE